MSKATAIVEMYRTTANGKCEWRWRIVHRNRRIIAASSEGYVLRSMCLSNLCLITNTEYELDGAEAAYHLGKPTLYRWHFRTAQPVVVSRVKRRR